MQSVSGSSLLALTVPKTLREALSTRDNALNFVRLLLAAVVVIAHAWLAGGFDGGEETARFSAWAGNGFFALSGYLIAGSRMRLGIREFVVNRVLRIFPAFWVVLIVIVIAFVIAPLTSHTAGWDYDPSSAVGYVFNNAGLHITQAGIDGTLTNAPWPSVWNLSLWTLIYEFGAYIGAAILLTLPWARKHPLVATGTAYALAVFAQACALSPLVGSPWQYLDMLRLAPWFIAGLFLYFLADRLRPTIRQTALAAALLAGLFAIGVADLIGHLPFAFILLRFASASPVRVGARNDISYGVYIYAWPIQQVLAALGADSFGPVWSGVLALAVTIPLAWASWKLVEEPSMRLRKRIPRRWYGDKPRMSSRA